MNNTWLCKLNHINKNILDRAKCLELIQKRTIHLSLVNVKVERKEKLTKKPFKLVVIND